MKTQPKEKKPAEQKPIDDGIGYDDLISQEAEDAILEYGRQTANRGGEKDLQKKLTDLNAKETALTELLAELDRDLANPPNPPIPVK